MSPTESALLKYGLPAIFLMAQALLVVLNLLKNKEQNKKQNQYRYNPHAPGEAQACKEHKAALTKLGEKLEEQGKAVVRVEEAQEAQEKRLDRIEGKLNGL